jgi:hypothetical protein
MKLQQLDQWYEPSATYFKVQSNEGKVYFLRYDEREAQWTLQSGFDGDEPLARQALNWSQSMLRLQRRPNSKLNRANTATLPMPRFRSTGFLAKGPTGLGHSSSS